MALLLLPAEEEDPEALPPNRPPAAGLVVPLLAALPNRLRVVVVAIVAGVSPLALPVLDFRPAPVPPPNRFFNSTVEKAAPVLRTGDEWVEDSADVLLSELDFVKRSVDTRPTRRPDRSEASSAGDDVLDAKLDVLDCSAGVDGSEDAPFLPDKMADLLLVLSSVSLVGVAVELLPDSVSAFFDASVVDVCREGVLLSPNLGRSPDVGVDGTLLAVAVVVVSVFPAAASSPLFCFLILAISSSSLTWRDALGGALADGLVSDWCVGAAGVKLSVDGGVGFFIRPFRSTSWRRLMTLGESANRVIPLSGPLAASSVSSTLWRSFLPAATPSATVSVWLKRTERPVGSLSESPESWWRMKRERKRVRRPLSAGESS